jgi:hypothetical protein
MALASSNLTTNVFSITGIFVASAGGFYMPGAVTKPRSSNTSQNSHKGKLWLGHNAVDCDPVHEGDETGHDVQVQHSCRLNLELSTGVGPSWGVAWEVAWETLGPRNRSHVWIPPQALGAHGARSHRGHQVELRVTHICGQRGSSAAWGCLVANDVWIVGWGGKGSMGAVFSSFEHNAPAKVGASSCPRAARRMSS